MRTIMLLAVAALALSISACDQPQTPPKPAPPSTVMPPATTNPSPMSGMGQGTPPAGKFVNTVCPVSGEKLGADAIAVAYEGKSIGLCCADCPKTFKENPAKYAANLK